MSIRFYNRHVLIGKRALVTMYFEKRDAWIGVYWDRSRDGDLSVYLCAVPFFPVKVLWLAPPRADFAAAS